MLPSYLSILALWWLPLCKAWLYVTDPRTRSTAEYTSVDFEGDVESPYTMTGLLLPINMYEGCKFSMMGDDWVPEAVGSNLANGTRADSVQSTFLLFNRQNAYDSGCEGYIKVMSQVKSLIKSVEARNYPRVELLIFASMIDSTKYFGSANDEYYTSYMSDKPNNVAVAYVGNDVALKLKEQAESFGPLLATAVEDEGVWNQLRQSPIESVMIAFRYIMIIPVMTFTLFFFCKDVYNERTLWTRRVMLLVAIEIFLLSCLIVPIGYPQDAYQIFIRYVGWLAGFGTYSWVLLSWANIIQKTQNPLFWCIFYYLIYTGIFTMVVHAIVNCVYTVVVTNTTDFLRNVVNAYILPPILVLQAIFILTYGTRFLRYIRHKVGFGSLRQTFRKLTYLSYGTFVGYIILAICTVMVHSYFSGMLWVSPFRSFVYNMASAVMAGIVLWILRVHEEQPLAAHPQTMDSDGTHSLVRNNSIGISSRTHFNEKPRHLNDQAGASPALHPISTPTTPTATMSRCGSIKISMEESMEEFDLGTYRVRQGDLPNSDMDNSMPHTIMDTMPCPIYPDNRASFSKPSNVWHP
ncbi:hypothetical protein H4R33_006108 [Dimargaris cristalligena]|uniref:Uncharacterized protein n=1 Tax=Dimargaris cristalligena TaxID=215637 RepID=A0A4P9ZVG3_9FUNG|nr:hypothetical protein H4R33_006108 [Dimargaris cristalligena]RKP37577.1 hypothetical protein BJ085DRAFT_37610 [Dimargaris cristalligena]|eukprot:RKP37577.1 hypothetical protein BJ085DRAFT_37610 [Dimargaris cristalligena]